MGQARTFLNPTSNLGETAFMVHPEWQGCCLGSALQACMTKHARRQGLRGFVADILPGNERMLRLARNGGARVQTQRDRDSVQITTLF